MTDTEKPKRLYFKTYIKLIKNSVSSEIFRNFYVSTSQRGEFDAMGDGENSCAFYVSSVLVIFKKASGVHGTVQSTIEDLKKSGWQEVDEPRPGDVLVWEALDSGDGLKQHVGFYIGDGQAISTSKSVKKVVRHDKDFGKDRKIEQIFRMPDWDKNDQP